MVKHIISFLTWNIPERRDRIVKSQHSSILQDSQEPPLLEDIIINSWERESILLLYCEYWFSPHKNAAAHVGSSGVC